VTDDSWQDVLSGEGDPWTDVLGFTDLGTADREQTIEEVKQLIVELADTHPEVFNDEPITPQEYNRELQDAIFSLGGTFRQSHGADNEDIVRNVFLDPAQDAGLLSYVDQRGNERIDFKGRISKSNEAFAIDVKGGEGQSIGHLLVPSNTDILTFWMERNSKNTKSPASRLNEIINRVVRWGINHDEHPRYVINQDKPAGATTDDGRVIPDVIVFPEQFPSPDNPSPEMPSVDDLHFPQLLYSILIDNDDIHDDEIQKHIWWHELHYREKDEKVIKNIYNSYDGSISLNTRPIDFERISDVT